MNNKIAIYLRLSLSDGDLKKGSKDESNSIENQRLLLHSYIEKQDDLPGEIVEYVDAAVIIGLKTIRLKKFQKHGAF